jgi:hypothetical protein
MYYENKKEKRVKGIPIFIAMIIIIGLLITLNLKLESLQNLRNSARIFCK